MVRWPVTMALVVAIFVSLAVAAAPAPATQQSIAQESRPTPVATFGGVSAWSHYEPGRGWRLRVYRNGITTTPAIGPNRQPFDVDLGPDSMGHVIAVYSRCPTANSFLTPNCRLYRYRMGGRGRRIANVSRPGYSERHPSIWRSRIAFARYRVRGQYDELDRIYLATRHHLRQMPHGSIRHTYVDADPDFVVQDLDLRGQRLAFSWTLPAERCPLNEPPIVPGISIVPQVTELWLVATDTGRAQRIRRGCSEDNNTIGDLSLQPSTLGFLQQLPAGGTAEQQIDPHTSHTTQQPLAGPTFSYDRDGSTRITCQTSAAQPTGCAIVIDQQG